ncbi:hypothetical protein CF8_3403 [Nocardioides sp. CF8]|uniref:hypothetical protein n=1 Tax=Nocardioides sp. CF8 TaxID=110319 RepID=UPI00032D99C8|nr:hypothetical protein [Nocardioides sp. CF8]EON22803.1 hypothetical protein CF8_3403 [Nocardioides sp. CF8]
MLPRFEIVRRLRPVSLIVPGAEVDIAPGEIVLLPQPSPSVAIVVEPDHRAAAAFHLGGMRLGIDLVGGRVVLALTRGHDTRQLRSRRHGTVSSPATRLALTLTGTHLTALTEEAGQWVARARIDLTDRVDLRDPDVLAHLRVEGHGARVQAGPFGQLGLRDLRLVTERDGTPVRDADRLLLSATSAGPGFFDTAHTSVWSLDPDSLDLRHRSDLFFRRPDKPGVYGDHATHVVRDGDTWLVATSTWGDFRQDDPTRSVRATLARTTADVLSGAHVLDTEELALPTDGFTSVGVWDPHLVHTGEEWLVGFASARKFFRFHPALASGPALDRLTLRGAAADRRATEGTTILRVGDEWRVLASDGRDGRRGQRARYPVFDLSMTEVGELAAPYPTNLPWPTLAHTDRGWLMITFNGVPATGPLVGYGTHGDLVVQREVRPD